MDAFFMETWKIDVDKILGSVTGADKDSIPDIGEEEVLPTIFHCALFQEGVVSQFFLFFFLLYYISNN